MERLIIDGGRELNGDVHISGAKNSALPIFAASILTPKKLVIKNVPRLKDIETISRLLASLGVEIKNNEDEYKICAEDIKNVKASYDLVKTMRASILVLGPLVARKGEALVSLPGGCAIGVRPVNLHLTALEMLGVKIKIESGYIKATANKLIGNKIHFDRETVTGTMNALSCAVLAEGVTELSNCAKEPEVSEFASLLNKMGGKIEGIGEGKMTIQGVSSLNGADIKIIPDRIETGTYMAAVGICGGRVKIKNCNPDHCGAIIDRMRECGLKIESDKETLIVESSGIILPTKFATETYPGFPTDMQAQIMAMLTITHGTSVIREQIFENRFMHVFELQRMGANITVNGNRATVTGIRELQGANVMATDLRASASLVIAGMRARGRTEISRIYHIDRGYENIESKLSQLGAKITRCN